MSERCLYCNKPMGSTPVEGTNPKDADDGWSEVYECPNGHTGTLRWTPGDGTTKHGAIADEVIL